jgi:hypothetical protein
MNQNITALGRSALATRDFYISALAIRRLAATNEDTAAFTGANNAGTASQLQCTTSPSASGHSSIDEYRSTHGLTSTLASFNTHRATNVR